MAMSIRSSESWIVPTHSPAMLTLFRLTPAMAMKHGYDSVEDYKDGVQKKFSLLETGVIQKPSCRLLLINVSNLVYLMNKFTLLIRLGDS